MTTSTIAVRVARKQLEATDICSFELSSVDGSDLPAFTAGSHIDVHTPGGHTRQYSLCNDPAERHRYLIGVLKDPATRGGSKVMHESVHEGDRLDISPPRNHFPLVSESSRTLLLAGGIGVTPLLCMAQRLARVSGDFEMHYFTRSRERTAFHSRITASGLASRVSFHHKDAAPERPLHLARLLATPLVETHLYVCGPKGFIDKALQTARANAWPEQHLHREFFSAAPPREADDGGFEVELASTGLVVAVPKNKTVIQALAASGIEVPTSCEQGVCGTCLTRVLAGEPDHRDLFLTPEEQAANDCFLPCCSRARSPRLVLDI